MKFTTEDRDQDTDPSTNVYYDYRAPFWYGTHAFCKLFGSYGDIYWYYFDYYNPLERAEMKFRAEY